jgi:hypothetical protein
MQCGFRFQNHDMIPKHALHHLTVCNHMPMYPVYNLHEDKNRETTTYINTNMSRNKVKVN